MKSGLMRILIALQVVLIIIQDVFSDGIIQQVFFQFLGHGVTEVTPGKRVEYVIITLLLEKRANLIPKASVQWERLLNATL